jgi:folate-dependent tRNA-U54 methylase TrmFO/GidA
MTKEVRERISDSVALSPRQISRIRGQIASHVRDLMPQAVEAARGERTWSNQQVTIFRALLAKVVPDLSQSHSTVDITTRQVTELTRDELEAIASGSDALDGVIVDETDDVKAKA